MTLDDSVLGDDETVRIETASRARTFRASLEDKGNGVVVVSPVPETVSVEALGYTLQLNADSVRSGQYMWMEHDLTDMGTKIVKLQHVDSVERPERRR